MNAVRRPLATAAAVAFVTAAGLLALAGCGGDSESTTAPQSSATPQTTKQTTTQSTTSTESTTTAEDNGGATPPSGGGDNTSSDGGSGGSGVPDTPSNDVTPPANTPQGKFEQYCNQNPGACG
ncbi:MAG: hypothetical protein AABM43_10505 [Actinomycetota bacterium]